MKKIITVAKNRNEIFKQPPLTIGVDLTKLSLDRDRRRGMKEGKIVVY